MGTACLLGALLAAGQTTSAASALSVDAVVTVTVENMYSAPDATRDVVSQATLGQLVAVLDEDGAFACVRTPDGYLGWLARSAIRPYPDPAAPRYASAGRVVEVTSLMANVYRVPDVTTAAPKILAPLATRLELAADGPSERWLAVRLPDGDTGYVQRGDVRRLDPAAAARRGTPRALVQTARRFLGVPYLWGGLTAHGLDCSGLTSVVYRANGVTLPRDAHLQFDAPLAAPVARAALRPGDLVFFGSDRHHISHVGLYTGAGRFISATTHETPTVREDRLDDTHWARIYQGARRPR